MFADDTPVKMLTPGAGKTQTARLWTYVRDERPWDSEALVSVLAGPQGSTSQGSLEEIPGLDACGRLFFNDLYRSGQKFVDVHKAQGSAIAQEAIKRIAGLYAIEISSPPDQRTAIRQGQTRLGNWLGAPAISGKSPLAGAIRYALTRSTAPAIP